MNYDVTFSEQWIINAQSEWQYSEHRCFKHTANGEGQMLLCYPSLTLSQPFWGSWFHFYQQEIIRCNIKTYFITWDDSFLLSENNWNRDNYLIVSVPAGLWSSNSNDIHLKNTMPVTVDHDKTGQLQSWHNENFFPHGRSVLSSDKETSSSSPHQIWPSTNPALDSLLDAMVPFELTFTFQRQGHPMTDSGAQHNLAQPHIALHLLCNAVDPFTNHPQLYTSAACQHLPGALTHPACNEKLSLLASTQQVYGPLGQLLGNATDLVVKEEVRHT